MTAVPSLLRAAGPAALALLALLAPAAHAAPAGQPGTFNVRDFGATGDGRTLDTPALNKAVAACSEAGGGLVLVPPGRYLSATVHLKSHVTFQLAAGATLVGCPDPEQYSGFTPPPGVPEAKFPSRWHRALLLADGADNVTVLGPGTVDGNRVFDPRGEENRRGPHTFLFGRGRRLRIADLAIRDSANYAMLLLDCSEVEIDRVRVTGGWDGLHFRGYPGRPCRDVRVTGCRFFTGDDAIAGRYWEDVLLSGCVLNSSCHGLRLIGPATRLTVHDCLAYGPGQFEHRTSGRRNMLSGLCLQPGAWDPTSGGLDDVLVSGVTLRSTGVPFLVTLSRGNTAGRITFERVSGTGLARIPASLESWSEAPIDRVVLRDVSLEYEGGPPAGKPDSARSPSVIRRPGADPRPLPPWGLYARNIRDLRLENVRLAAAREDSRPAMLAEDVAALTLDGFRRPIDPPSGGISGGGPADPVVLRGVTSLLARDAGLSLLTPTCTGVTIRPAPGADRVTPGQPFDVLAILETAAGPGLARIDLEGAGPPRSHWVWLRPGERREVTFSRLTAPAAGRHELTVAGRRAPFTVDAP